MGGPLSGTLANIYLAHMELYNFNKISDFLLFNRYMDDILIICNFSDMKLQQYITSLECVYNLKLVASYNKHNVNYLDMNISISFHNKQLNIQPYSKKFLIYPLPTSNSQSQFKKDLNIINSQILRTWRISTNDQYFTQSINTYLPFLQSTSYHRLLRKNVFKFLQPIKVSTHKWTTILPICETCNNVIEKLNIYLHKILKVQMRYIATKCPLNCKSQNIHILLNKDATSFQLLHVFSLHQYLQNLSIRDANILPIGFLNLRKMKEFLIKHPTVECINRNNIIKTKHVHPCFIHKLFHKSSSVYGIHSSFRKKPSFGTMFNKYKKISRNK
jgi:hypothetical protein